MATRYNIRRNGNTALTFRLILNQRVLWNLALPIKWFKYLAIVFMFLSLIWVGSFLVGLMQIDESMQNTSTGENASNVRKFSRAIQDIDLTLLQLESIYKRISRARYLNHSEEQLNSSGLYRIYIPEKHDQGGSDFEDLPAKKRKKTFPLKRRVLVTNAFVKDISHFADAYGIWYQFYPTLWPLKGDPKYVTSGFGYRIEPTGYNMGSTKFHNGIDLRAKTGTAVVATAAGTVHIATALQYGYGKRIRIVHDTGFETLYAHLSEIKVKENQRIRQGQLIGRVGSSGNSTGPHLHYEVSLNGKKFDPSDFMDP